MVKLDKIYTRTGDKSRTRLSTGEEVAKWHPRVASRSSGDHRLHGRRHSFLTFLRHF